MVKWKKVGVAAFVQTIPVVFVPLFVSISSHLRQTFGENVTKAIVERVYHH